MANKKTTKKTNKPNEVTYKGRKYIVLEETEDKIKLTDKVIHFWVKKEIVEAE